MVGGGAGRHGCTIIEQEYVKWILDNTYISHRNYSETLIENKHENIKYTEYMFVAYCKKPALKGQFHEVQAKWSTAGRL